MSDFMSWTLQLRPLAGGFVGAKRAVDLQSGEEALHLFRLTGAGKLATMLPLAEVGPPMLERLGRFELPPASHSPNLLLAASDSAALRHHFMALQPLVEQHAPQGLADVVSFGDDIWALVGDPLQPGTAQSLLHLDLKALDRPYLHDVPLTALRLGGGRWITAMATVNGYVYAGVCDPLAGFDLYRLDATEPEAGFASVLTGGAHRFALNAAISAMEVRGDALLIGTAALASGVDPVGQWGPELLLIDADDSWDLVIGQPRFTPDGMRFPASNLLPGLGRLDNAAIRAIATGYIDGEAVTCIAVQDHAGPSAADRRLVGPEDLHSYSGEVRLYLSRDLEEWSPLEVSMPAGSGAVTALAVSASGVLVGHESLSPDEVPATFVPHSGL
jgi:hypothetical protein